MIPFQTKLMFIREIQIIADICAVLLMALVPTAYLCTAKTKYPSTDPITIEPARSFLVVKGRKC